MIRAKKHFGQNFLKDKSIISKITQAIPKGTANIVEIGPGLGDLTKELIKIAKVKAYEIDTDLIALLEREFGQSIADGTLSIVAGDVLEYFGSHLDSGEYFLCANLPYYVATNIVLNALKDELCTGILVMVQKEVAQRFVGEDFCALSVLAGCVCECSIICDVAPSCFEPAPKVDSAVMMLRRVRQYSDLFATSGEFESFCGFVKDCFGAPRKKLLSNLKKYKQTNEILSFLGINENIRAHELDVRSFVEIFKRIKDERPNK